MWTFLHQLASPPHFYRLARSLIPWLTVPAYALLLYGTFAGLFLAPQDYQQKDAFRIVYVHAPAAYLSMMAYVVMAAAGGVGLIWRMELAHAVAASAAAGNTAKNIALATKRYGWICRAAGTTAGKT